MLFRGTGLTQGPVPPPKTVQRRAEKVLKYRVFGMVGDQLLENRYRFFLKREGLARVLGKICGIVADQAERVLELGDLRVRRRQWTRDLEGRAPISLRLRRLYAFTIAEVAINLGEIVLVLRVLRVFLNESLADEQGSPQQLFASPGGAASITKYTSCRSFRLLPKSRRYSASRGNAVLNCS